MTLRAGTPPDALESEDGNSILVGLARLALALEYMHHHQLLHRDIKAGPCNLQQVQTWGPERKAWCLLMHAEASLSLSKFKRSTRVYSAWFQRLRYGGQGDSLVPPYTLGSVSLSQRL